MTAMILKPRTGRHADARRADPEAQVAEFGPKAFRDRCEEALLAHLKTKRVGAVREERLRFAAPRRVTNLMEALRQSIAQDQKPAVRDPQRGCSI